MCRAFTLAGASTDLVHLDAACRTPDTLDRYDVIGFPGGFSYGDDVASGRIFAMRVRERLYPALARAISRGVPILGACNGFQVLVQVGLLPGPDSPDPEAWPTDQPPAQTVALTDNRDARFRDEWVRVSVQADSPCVWTAAIAAQYTPEEAALALRLPIAHGEGRFVAADPALVRDLIASGRAPVRYVDDPNGSDGAIAGVCDASGRVFGLMPHPERYLDWTRHPFWTRLPASLTKKPTPGLLMFRAAVDAARLVAR
jgi:phosphoribosylformylglycinamidine synthase